MKKRRGNAIVTLGRNTLSTISLLWSVARLPQRKISYVRLCENSIWITVGPLSIVCTL
jgi:hypothetical protein